MLKADFRAKRPLFELVFTLMQKLRPIVDIIKMAHLQRVRNVLLTFPFKDQLHAFFAPFSPRYQSALLTAYFYVQVQVGRAAEAVATVLATASTTDKQVQDVLGLVRGSVPSQNHNSQSALWDIVEALAMELLRETRCAWRENCLS
jgi:hypothetical protein